MGVVARLLGVESIEGSTTSATSPPEIGTRRCVRCEVGWHGDPYCWMCDADVRYQTWKGDL